jgi:hypothetical protein
VTKIVPESERGGKISFRQFGKKSFKKNKMITIDFGEGIK